MINMVYYRLLIEHVSFQIVSFIHTFFLHTIGSKVDTDYIPDLVFFHHISWAKRCVHNTQMRIIYGRLRYVMIHTHGVLQIVKNITSVINIQMY